MPLFEFEVADRTGTVGRGRTEADNPEELIRRFRGRDQVVLSLRPAEPVRLPGRDIQPALDALQRSVMRIAGGVKLTTLILFTGQLAAMLGGGIHLVRSLSVLAAEATDKRFGKAVEKVRASVMGGTSFGDALSEYPSIFNSLYVAMVQAGELSGNLPLVLNTLTTYLEKADLVRRKVRGAFAYPGVILSAAVLIVLVMIVKIVPVFEGVYARANARLPAATLVLLGLSRVLRDYTLLSVLALALVAVVVVVAVHRPAGQYLLDAFKLRMPLFGPLIRKAILARVCRTLSALLQSGIPLLGAMEATSRAASNRVIERALLAASYGMREGATVADALRRTGQFPGMVTQLVTAGEESGTLPAMLGKAAVYYEQQVDSTVGTLSSLIQPVMIVIMGGLIAAVIFALYLPIFNLGQAFKSMR